MECLWSIRFNASKNHLLMDSGTDKNTFSMKSKQLADYRISAFNSHIAELSYIPSVSGNWY